MISDVDKIVRKIYWRVLPFLCLGAFLASIDKSNMGMASIQMNDRIGLSPSVYGLGISLFFVVYALCEVPSNMGLARFGARVWLARIMLTWGLVSAASALIVGPQTFLLNRILLGAAEAGYMPGALAFIAAWLPKEYRSRAMSYFMLSTPLAVMVGGPISAMFLSLDGVGGLHGWQWLFLCEGIPTVLLGLVILRMLRDRPEHAGWLSPAEVATLNDALGQDAASTHVRPTLREVGQAIIKPVVALFTLILACLGGVTLGVSFWLPQIVKAQGLTEMQTGLVSASPYALGIIGAILWSRHSDRTKEKRWHIAVPAMAAGLALATITFIPSFPARIVMLAFAVSCILSLQGIFWAAAASALRGSDRVIGIAVINAGGTMISFLGPYLIGLSKQMTGGFDVAFMILGVMGVVGGILAVLLLHFVDKADPAPAAQPA